MKNLLLAVLAITSCGTDPDDFKVQPSDGCPSSGCVAPAPEPAPVPAPVPDPVVTVETTTKTTVSIPSRRVAPVCAEGKICKGMPVSDLIEIVGDPQSVDEWFGVDRWVWQENHAEICGRAGPICWIEVSKGKVTAVHGIAGEWIDLEKW